MHRNGGIDETIFILDVRDIVPFCSHGGGRFGQSLTAIAKLVPDATLGEGLSIHYSGGSTLAKDVTDWLKTNQIPLAG